VRTVETSLARFSLAILVVYVPVETWASPSHGLLHPMYLVDLIAMCLLFFGARHSLAARPASAPGPLAAAWGWTAANGWRATAWRWLDALENQGRELDHGRAELWAVTIASALALVCFAAALTLAWRAARLRQS